MTQRYFIELAYNGTRFHGWQIQPNAIGVQEVLEKALGLLLREPVRLTGTGRTDTGVHASFYVAHFDAHQMLDSVNLVYKLNSFLNSDIVIYRIYQVKNEAHARFDALSRTYQYTITTQKDPFAQETTFYFAPALDIEKMNECCKILFEYTDFTSFSKLHSDVKTNNCSIYKAEWYQHEHRLVFVIQANRFLRNMVRAIVGTLLDVGLGKITNQQFRQIIEQKDRGLAGTSAPAQGLCLTHIEYPFSLAI